jgi:hypothetical protein
MFELKFPISEVGSLAGRYRYLTDKSIFDEAIPIVRQVGYLTKKQMQAVARWKPPRAAPKIENNSDSLIVEATRIALSSPHEEIRVRALTLIHGVGFPMASVVLHWFHPDRYPILDFRALWSLGVEELPTYTFPFWWAYTQACRRLADEAGVNMRVLDQALWQYSKENQAEG